MKPHRKGHATQIMRFYERNGYLTRRQVEYARKIMAEVPTHLQKGPNESEKLRQAATDKEFEFFQKEFDRNEKMLPPSSRGKASPGYKSFKNKMSKILRDD